MSAVSTFVAPLRLRCKVLLLGETTVGKTSICQTFCSNGTEFPKNYLMTVCCDLQVKVVQIPDTSVSVELFIYDCSGQDIFRDQLAQVLEGACAVVYVYRPFPSSILILRYPTPVSKLPCPLLINPPHPQSQRPSSSPLSSAVTTSRAARPSSSYSSGRTPPSLHSKPQTPNIQQMGPASIRREQGPEAVEGHRRRQQTRRPG